MSTNVKLQPPTPQSAGAYITAEHARTILDFLVVATSQHKLERSLQRYLYNNKRSGCRFFIGWMVDVLTMSIGPRTVRRRARFDHFTRSTSGQLGKRLQRDNRPSWSQVTMSVYALSSNKSLQRVTRQKPRATNYLGSMKRIGCFKESCKRSAVTVEWW